MPSLATLFFLISSLIIFARAGAHNITIDDENGDEVTGVLPVYQPSTAWSPGTACPTCWAKPDPANATDGTWHDTSAYNNTPSTVTLQFTGTAVYVFCIIPNLVNGSHPTHTNTGFNLDGISYPLFQYESDTTTNMEYNTMVFSQDGLQNQPHTLVVSAIARSVDEPAVMLFDYALYTSEQSTGSSNTTGAVPSSHPAPSSRHTAAPIVGGVIGFILLATLAGLLVWLRRRRALGGRARLGERKNGEVSQHSTLISSLHVNPYEGLNSSPGPLPGLVVPAVPFPLSEKSRLRYGDAPPMGLQHPESQGRSSQPLPPVSTSAPEDPRLQERLTILEAQIEHMSVAVNPPAYEAPRG